MTRWARLTWQAPDPAALAAELAHRLGVVPVTHGPLRDAFSIDLGTTDLELVAWQREVPTDEPQAAGRLVLEPIEGGAPDPSTGELPPLLLAGIGWATVELDRAEAELEPWLEPSMPAAPNDDGTEPHLGARTRIRDTRALPGDTLVLEEPTTEGRLAASLARDGEGPFALYVWPSNGLDDWLTAARARGVATSTIQPGPFGRSVLALGSAVAGPHVIVVGQAPASSGRGSAGTIEP